MESYCILETLSNSIKVGNFTVITNDETDGYGALTVQDAISCFLHFAQGRQFKNTLEWCCGPRLFWICGTIFKLTKQISFSDISEHAQSGHFRQLRNQQSRLQILSVR